MYHANLYSRRFHSLKSVPFMLSISACATLYTLGCQEADETAEYFSPSSDSATNNRESRSGDGQFQEEFYGGEQVEGDSSYQPSDPQGGGGGASDQRSTGEAEGEADSATQTWQESEAAQRQPIVDVGGGHQLSLHSQRVITQVEGHRARTIVDQVFYSPYDRELEGTFRYTLPVGASVSQYALYLGRITGEFDELGDRVSREVPLAQEDRRDLLELEPKELIERVSLDEEAWGELRLGRVVSQADGREAFEDTTRRRVDPALVENVQPNAFQARVFPIPARGYTRVIFAYEENLARVGDELVYTFPLPEGELAHLSYQLIVDEQAQTSQEAQLESSLPLSPLPARQAPDQEGGAEPTEGTETTENSEITGSEERQDAWSGDAEGEGPGGAVILRLPVEGDIEVIRGEDRATKAFAGRLTLEGLSAGELGSRPAHERVIFALDTSLSSSPTRFNINRQLIEEILSRDSAIREFAILSFDLGAEWLTEGFVANTAESRSVALSEVDQILLEGATRFDSVIDALGNARWISGEVDLFLLSDGAVNWGTVDPTQIALGLTGIDRVFAYRTGVGAENEALYRALTQRGGLFSCLTMESIQTCATAHRSPSLKLISAHVEQRGERPASVREFIHTHRGADVSNGSELQFAGEITELGSASLVLTLSNGSEQQTISYPLDLSSAEGNLAPRAWAELLVSAMSGTGDATLGSLIHALAQRYTILTREVVLLVLEADEDYVRYDLPTVWEETLAGVDSILDRLAQSLSAGVLYTPLIEHVLAGISPQIEDAIGQDLDGLLSDLELRLTSLSLPPVAYRHHAAREENQRSDTSQLPSDFGVFLDRAEQRYADGLENEAARALSTIVENDPANGVALRLVAYRLHTWGFLGLSAELFTEVLRRRPYEPQSYRDLAYVVRSERPELAAVLYEVATRGQWDARFHDMNTLIREEYALFIRSLERASHPLAARLSQRGRTLEIPNANADLRVILSWNTDNVDIDLWVTDPSGEKCFYGNQNTVAGGELLDDVTQGFGPERFVQSHAQAGEYRVQAHYYSNNGNLLEAETFIHVTVIKYAGSDREEITEFDALLAESNTLVDMARIHF